MIGYALNFAFACFGIAQLMCLYRVIFAKVLGDRIVALDTMSVNMVALLTLFGIRQGTHMYFELSLLIAMFGFISTVAYTKFVLRGDIIE